MRSSGRFEHGFSLNELLMTIAVAGTLMVVAVPVVSDVSEGTKLTAAARELEREFQSARLKSVTINRILRVRLNCPAAGSYRTIEYLDTSADSATNRCALGAYPFPADDDLMTLPNYDGPVRMLPRETTVGTAVVQFHPDGTARLVVSGIAQKITAPVTVTVTRKDKSKAITINGAGKIQIQQ